jgi:hypothetical protein
MNDPQAVAGWLLVAGPVLGLIPVGHPALVPIWSMPRDAFVATVAAHRVAWAWLNAGFTLASIATAAGLLALSGIMPDRATSAALLACTAGYGIGAVLWCAVLAIRTRTTPLLADLGACELDRPPARLLDAATTALFQAFVLITAASLAGLGAVQLMTGPTPAWVAAALLLTGTAATAWLLRTGDLIPAVLYLPTALLGITML